MYRVRPSRQNTLTIIVSQSQLFASWNRRFATGTRVVRFCGRVLNSTWSCTWRLWPLSEAGRGREALCYYGAHGWQISHPAANLAIKLQGHLARRGTCTRATRFPPKALHVEQLDFLANQIINRITFDHYERRQGKVRFTRGYRQNAGQN